MARGDGSARKDDIPQPPDAQEEGCVLRYRRTNDTKGGKERKHREQGGKKSGQSM